MAKDNPPTAMPPLSTGHELEEAPDVAHRLTKQAPAVAPQTPFGQSGEAANEPINLPTKKHRVG